MPKEAGVTSSTTGARGAACIIGGIGGAGVLIIVGALAADGAGCIITVRDCGVVTVGAWNGSGARAPRFGDVGGSSKFGVVVGMSKLGAFEVPVVSSSKSSGGTC